MPPNEERIRSVKVQESVNPYNDSTKRPAPPRGSGGSSQAAQDQAKQTPPKKDER